MAGLGPRDWARRDPSIGLPHTGVGPRDHRGQDGAPKWLFSQDGGVTPWRPDYVTLAFTCLRKSLGLDSVRLHDLRHFVATSMLSDGVPLSTVSNRLGHARTSTTLDRDSHWMPQQDQDAADRLDEPFT